MHKMNLPISIVSFAYLLLLGGTSLATDFSGSFPVPKHDRAMKQAIELARGGLEGFLDIQDMKPVGTGFYSVKIGIKDAGNSFRITSAPEEDDVEFFWLGTLKKTPTGFSGEIQEIPEIMKNVVMGQRVEFRQSDIVDWFYFDKGKMKGNFTACPALAHATDDEREAFNKEYGTRCK